MPRTRPGSLADVPDASLLELKASGVQGCAVEWTRLVDFYGAFGFKPWRTYLRASKPLGSG